MKINNLINIIKKKISDKIICEELNVEDKTFLHVKHKNFDKKRFHIKIEIKSKQLKIKNKIAANKIIFSIIEYELKKYIHSVQILIN
jgi:stress-induced morphogen|tara:strand:- start:340 stop:600 length:261 start_codon:yes stop_codon:yes gene_type:complete